MESFKKLMIERTACLGQCPVYRAEVTNEGTVHFTGTAWVRREGEHAWKIFQGQIDSLNKLLKEYDYFNIPEYELKHQVLDAPSCIIRVVMETGQERITVNNSAEGRYPEKLSEFQDKVDEIIGTANFKSTD